MLIVGGNQVSAQPDIHKEARAVNKEAPSSEQCPLSFSVNSPTYALAQTPPWPPSLSTGPQRKQNSTPSFPCHCRAGW